VIPSALELSLQHLARWGVNGEGSTHLKHRKWSNDHMWKTRKAKSYNTWQRFPASAYPAAKPTQSSQELTTTEMIPHTR
jgi:L,D-peptidoglycan transpeptidase YkuD (ErfK/YbiS/YcfS/YnhG family)